MLTLSQVATEAHRTAVTSAREHKEPLAYWAQDLDHPETLGSMLFLGSRKRIRGQYGTWTQVDVNTLIDYPYNFFFVDSSGLGSPDEPALTLSQFGALLKVIGDIHGYKYGLSIWEAGEFQVHVALYEFRKHQRTSGSAWQRGAHSSTKSHLLNGLGG